MSCLRSLICALAAMLAALNVSAQQITGSIRGIVSDPSGALVQAAAVTVKQSETGLTRTAPGWTLFGGSDRPRIPEVCADRNLAERQ
jgi:hypothetical protein